MWYVVCLVAGFLGGYAVCYFWGQSRKSVAKIIDKGESIFDEIKD